MAVRIGGHANKISFPLQSKYISNIPYPQLIAVNRRGGEINIDRNSSEPTT